MRLNWKVKTKNLDNEIKTYYFDSDDKKNINVGNKELIIKISRNYEIFNYKINNKDLKDIIDEWLSLINAGFDELYSLEIVKNNSLKTKIQTILESIILDVKEGISLNDAFESKKKYFPSVFIEVLKVSIKGNNIKNGLLMMSEYLTDLISSMDKAKNITLYPKIISLVILVVVFVISKFIIPSYVELFIKNNVQLNGISTLLINFFVFVGNNMFFIILFLIGLVLILKSLSYTGFFSWLCRYLPVIKNYKQYIDAYMFCSMTHLLWSSGVNKAKSVKLVGETISNKFLRKKLMLVYDDILNGSNLSESIKDNKVFDTVLVKMFYIGEQNNMIENNLKNAIKFYKYKYQFWVKRLLVILEPLLLVLLSIVVMVIILVIFIPMMNSFRMVG